MQTKRLPKEMSERNDRKSRQFSRAHSDIVFGKEPCVLRQNAVIKIIIAVALTVFILHRLNNNCSYDFYYKVL